VVDVTKDEAEDSDPVLLADAIDRLLAAARLMITRRPYASVEGAAQIITEARVVASLLAHDDVHKIVHNAIDLLCDRRGLPPSGEPDAPLCLTRARSVTRGPVIIPVEEILRAAHTLDLIRGDDSSVRAIITSALEIDQTVGDEDVFTVAMSIAEDFRRRGGIARLFSPGDDATRPHQPE
jgi:hypothetical protein